MHRKKRPDDDRRRSGEDAAKTSCAEMKYHGLAACREMWRARPDDVIRIYLNKDTLDPVRDMLKWAASRRKAYHVVENDDLERLTGSIHHQGICVLGLEKPAVRFGEFVRAASDRRDPLLAAWLDGVRNTYNLGAIVRTCAHFGVEYLLGEEDRLPALTASALRVAMGGAEHVHMIRVAERDPAIEEIKRAGFTVLSTDSKGEPVDTCQIPRRTLMLLGSETAGVSRELRAHAARTVAIPGTGKVESLNVSVAFGVLAGEFRRRYPLREKRVREKEKAS